jgi:hypothetical protein
MLHIVLFALSSPPADLPISTSINLVQRSNYKCIRRHRSASVLTMGIQPKMISMAMSNIDGTTVLDEDLELNDEELELIAQRSRVATSICSDVFVNGQQIISLDSVLQYENDHQGLIDFIKRQFRGSISDLVAGVLSDNLRAVAPRVIKGQRGGFKINLENGQVCYEDTPCPF